MSYCRSSEKDSDVYIYSSGDKIYVHIAYKIADKLNEGEDTFYSNSRIKIINYLLNLREKGIQVLEHPLRRLAYERQLIGDQVTRNDWERMRGTEEKEE